MVQESRSIMKAVKPTGHNKRTATRILFPRERPTAENVEAATPWLGTAQRICCDTGVRWKCSTLRIPGGPTTLLMVPRLGPAQPVSNVLHIELIKPLFLTT